MKSIVDAMMISEIHTISLYIKRTLGVILFIAAASCARLDELGYDVAVVASSVETVIEAVDVFQEASQEGNDVSDINVDTEATVITMSDGDAFSIPHAGSGMTPILHMDVVGYWTASFDNGRTYTKVLDNQGNQVCGVRRDGKDGVYVRIDVNNNGYFVFKLYNSNNEDAAYEVVKTRYLWHKSQILNAIILDKTNNTITFIMPNGDSFTFSHKATSPSGIDIMITEPLVLRKKDTVTFDFRIHPSDASLNYDIYSNEGEVFLNLVAETKTDVTAPSNYRLSKVEPAYDERGTVEPGRYRAYVTDSGINALYRDVISLVINAADETGQEMTITSQEIDIQFMYNVITEFKLLSKNNHNSVIYDADSKIEGNEITITSPYIASASNLVVSFRSNDCIVKVNGVEQESGVTANDFSEPVIYTVVDQNGKAPDNEFKVTLVHPGFPIVMIDTPNSSPIKSKTEWMEGVSMKIIDTQGQISYDGSISIKGRGNSTWGYPKKPYAIKLDRRESVLGMPEHKRWVLLANWMDRTLLRNRVAFKLGECTQMEYTPRGEYVELVLNGKHKGNYFLCEQVKVDENRVDITEITPDSEDITGGYLLELDKYFDEEFKFRSSVKQFPYMFKDPDEDITDEMFAYLQGYINEMEDSLYNNFDSGKWKEYIDMESFVDYWFATELTSVKEVSHPKSVFMYKDMGGKLCAGPMWDYDWDTFVPKRSNSYVMKKYLYYPMLFKDQEFVSIVKERWAVARDKFYKIPDFIDSERERLRNSEMMNIAMWPISSKVNGDEKMSFDEAVDRLKTSYIDKLKWLDTQIKNM